MTDNIQSPSFEISRSDRSAHKKHNSFVLWFTGLSGSGKSTLADLVEKHLMNLGVHTYILDGDNIRKGLNKDLGFSNEDRTENIRRIGEVSSLFVDKKPIQLNEICKIELSLSADIFYDPFEVNKITGSFILVDPDTKSTVGAGMIL